MQIESNDFKFSKYLQNKTKYDADIFRSYYERINKILLKGKITTDKQFYDVYPLVSQQWQHPVYDENKIKILHELFGDYEQRKRKKQKANT